MSAQLGAGQRRTNGVFFNQWSDLEKLSGVRCDCVLDFKDYKRGTFVVVLIFILEYKVPHQSGICSGAR